MENDKKIDVLLLNILRGNANEEEIRFFSEWVKDEKNTVYFYNIKKAWTISESLSFNIPVNQTGREQYLNRIRRDKRRAKLRHFISASASVAAILIIAYFILEQTTNVNQLPEYHQSIAEEKIVPDIENDEVTITSSSINGDVLSVETISNGVIRENPTIEMDDSSSPTIKMNTLFVPKGKRILVILSDGTKMWVNSDSKVVYPAIFAKDKRVLEVVGNVYFDVAKDKSRPFEVLTNGTKTTALGTQFEVNNYGGLQCQIALLEGVIRVENGSKKLIVEPNNQVVANVGSDDLIESSLSTQNYGLWRENILSIDNEPISSIIEKLNRWHNIKIINKTKDINQIYFTGKLSDGTLEEHLKIIADNIKIKFTKEGDTMIVRN